MSQIKLCKCDMPDCETAAQVPELGVGHIRCPPHWCEIRAFPPGENRQLSAHVCPDCYATKLLPFFQAGFERDEQRQRDIAARGPTGDLSGGPAWLSRRDVSRLKAGVHVDTDADDDAALYEAVDVQAFVRAAKAILARERPQVTWESLERADRSGLLRRAVAELKK